MPSTSVTSGLPTAKGLVAIVGAGLCGLAAAWSLRRQGRSVLLLDKSRGVGGRMATRRDGAAVFDHGAQFFTVRSPEFRELVDAFPAATTAWGEGFVDATGELPAKLRYPRYRGTSGMTSLAKALAADLDIRLGGRVTALHQDASAWRLQVDGDGPHEVVAAQVLLTCPVPQARDLLPKSLQATWPELAELLYDPCYALMVSYPEGTKTTLPPPGARRISAGAGGDDVVLSFLADNQAKGISPAPAYTLHSTAAFAATHMDTPAESVTELMLAAATRWLPSVSPEGDPTPLAVCDAAAATGFFSDSRLRPLPRSTWHR